MGKNDMNNIFDPEQIQYMVDLETLSTETDSVIVSIGAVKFSLGEGIIDTFEINVDPFDGRRLGLHISKDTIDWWKKQPKEVSDLWKVDPQPVKTAMTEFCKFYGGKSLPIYGNSPQFDMMILKSSMKVTNIPCPWSHYDEIDYRTMCKMVSIPYEKGDTLHSALNDAITQAKHVIKILKS
jgi:DNA polymerase III epsilon subunit-like protein